MTYTASYTWRETERVSITITAPVDEAGEVNLADCDITIETWLGPRINQTPQATIAALCGAIRELVGDRINADDRHADRIIEALQQDWIRAGRPTRDDESLSLERGSGT